MSDIKSTDGRATTGTGWMLWCIEAEKERDALERDNGRLSRELEEVKTIAEELKGRPAKQAQS